MRERISVMIPVHNGQTYLAACVESVAAQTYRELDILVVNDGSTDGTQRVCDELAVKYGNVRCFTLPDVGVSAARNFAMEQAEGSFYMFVDADDRLKRDAVEMLYRTLIETKSDIAGCRFCIWRTEGELQTALHKPVTEAQRKVREFDGRHFLTDNLLQSNSRCWSKLYRKEVVEGVRFRTDLTIGEDMMFLVDIWPRVQRAVEMEYEGYCYYQNPSGLMRRPFHEKYMDQITCWELARREIEKREEITPELSGQMSAKVQTAVLLVVGKIALLPPGKWKGTGKYLTVCREKLKEERKRHGAYSDRYLPGGYGLKARFFALLPMGYVVLYHALHRLKR